MKKLELVIEQDMYPESPRTSWENLSTMVCFHGGGYNLGDKHDYKSSMFNGWEGLKKQILKDYKGVKVIKPLYLYDHGGITISTSPFSCQWDSGQVGWVFTTREGTETIWGSKCQMLNKKGKYVRVTKEVLERNLDNEVKMYDNYLTGDVWKYVIKDEEGNTVDSCGGWYGDEGKKECEEEGERSLQYLQKEESCVD
jgi:hypothetical protein